MASSDKLERRRLVTSRERETATQDQSGIETAVIGGEALPKVEER